ncbi:ABC transporter ATP-binding protein [Lysinibacillus agricola]|uniref:ABC transporter ATP-binding protein n=1 Tax=Lysinibacillus agricola TaxID=2590012 RepID=A0ABX7ARB7_9BACI|nr:MULTISPECIES: ABC transporter ATP-binding protein [Lysinibacillus]KOS61645.1 multidrug ABC transporter ATP-binding protein [Lysinibacillus sp. FJAT-14222]QQP12340.1 ABC transporter ATP-binding protein [Lysinibacillus agricola]
MALIELINVSKSFKNNPIFTDISVRFEKGYIYGITGNNGSGKSVLFKMICGFIPPDEGSIVIDPDYMELKTKFPKNFGIIIDRPGYDSSKNGFDNLKTLAIIQNLVSDGEIKNAMKIVGLDPNNKQKVKHYSLGMKQKLSLAQAIMENQQVLILDEPFNALDSESVENIRKLLLDYKNNGKTIFITSHNQEDIDLLCDHVLTIDNYKLVKVK